MRSVQSICCCRIASDCVVGGSFKKLTDAFVLESSVGFALGWLVFWVVLLC